MFPFLRLVEDEKANFFGVVTGKFMNAQDDGRRKYMVLICSSNVKVGRSNGEVMIYDALEKRKSS
jgi:hypothetical protein